VNAELRHNKHFFNFIRGFAHEHLLQRYFIGMLFLAGLTGFVFSEFIMSSALFAMAAITSNIYRTDKHIETGRATFE
jgi:hypothetical protein